MRYIIFTSVLVFTLSTFSQEMSDEKPSIVLYTMSPYFGPSACEMRCQIVFGFTYSASSHLNNRHFSRKNRRAEKELIKRNGKNWKDNYNKMVDECTA
jgi:uncharacterized C2H2 Zn-finger protein